MPLPTAALLAATLAWVAAVTGLPPAPAPRIVITERGPDGTPLAHRLPAGTRYPDRARGAAAGPGIVYLPLGWTEGDPIDDCILAHEIVHIFQYASGRRYHCTEAMEPLAYAVENYCLAQRGVDYWRAKGMTPLRQARLTECPER
jgi:hypothetical protein